MLNTCRRAKCTRARRCSKTAGTRKSDRTNGRADRVTRKLIRATTPGDWEFCDPTVRSRDGAPTPDITLPGVSARGEGGQKLQRYFRDGTFAEQVRVPTEDVAHRHDRPGVGWAVVRARDGIPAR